VIGSCAPLSGQQKIRGTQVVSGGDAYFKYINDQGGVFGRKIRLSSHDDKYQPEVTITCFNENLKGKCFVGTLFQGAAAAAKLVAMSDTQHFPMVGFSTGSHFIVQPVHPYVFQVRASYLDEASEMIKSLWTKAGFKKFAILYQADAYGGQCREAVTKALKQENSAPVADVSFERLTTDVDPVLKQVMAAKPDVVIVVGGGDAPVILTKKLRKQNVPVVSFASTSDLLVEEAGKDADGTLLTQVFPYVHNELPTVQLYKRLTAKYEHTPPSVSGFEGFLMAMTVVEGLKGAGKALDREKFVHALESMHDFDLGLGPQYKLTFGPKRHDALRGTVSWTIIKNGKLEPFDDWSSLKR
jgi:ABC-type branched-subunit amino acid transport system substrate-binding protein